MTPQEILDRILLEVRTYSIPASENYIPTLDHYIPVRMFAYYASLLYGAGYDEGKKVASHPKPVIQKKDGKIIKIWTGGQAEAARHFIIGKEAIHKAITGKRKTCHGFEWEYLLEEKQ